MADGWPVQSHRPRSNNMTSVWHRVDDQLINWNKQAEPQVKLSAQIAQDWAHKMAASIESSFEIALITSILLSLSLSLFTPTLFCKKFDATAFVQTINEPNFRHFFFLSLKQTILCCWRKSVSSQESYRWNPVKMFRWYKFLLWTRKRRISKFNGAENSIVVNFKMISWSKSFINKLKIWWINFFLKWHHVTW